MPQCGSGPNLRQLEQVIETVFTCRTVVKYDLQLSEAQKDILLKDIDAALDVLRSRMILPAPSDTDVEEEVVPPATLNKVSLVPFASDALAKDAGPSRSKMPDVPDTQPSARSESGQQAEPVENDGAQVLQALYRMYHAYIDAQQGPTIATFVTRFNTAMATISEIQQLFQQGQVSYAGGAYTAGLAAASEESFEQLRVFIADLYSIFMDFIGALSETLQQNDVQLNTEQLNATQAKVPTSQFISTPLADFAQFYERYRGLTRRKETALKRVAVSTAFLEFLKERVNVPLHKISEVQLQSDNVIALLQEITTLLEEYEKTMAFFLFQGKP